MYVVDNTVLSNFAAVGKMNLLQEILNDSAFTTDEVQEEFRYKREFRSVNIGFPVIESLSEELEMLERSLRITGPRGLHAGELSCVLQVVNGKADTILTDDMLARKYCEREKIEVHGTVFVLALGVKEKMLDLRSAESILDEMKIEGYSLESGITVQDALSKFRS